MIASLLAIIIISTCFTAHAESKYAHLITEQIRKAVHSLPDLNEQLDKIGPIEYRGQKYVFDKKPVTHEQWLEQVRMLGDKDLEDLVPWQRSAQEAYIKAEFLDREAGSKAIGDLDLKTLYGDCLQIRAAFSIVRADFDWHSDTGIGYDISKDIIGEWVVDVGRLETLAKSKFGKVFNEDILASHLRPIIEEAKAKKIAITEDRISTKGLSWNNVTYRFLIGDKSEGKSRFIKANLPRREPRENQNGNGIIWESKRHSRWQITIVGSDNIDVRIGLDLWPMKRFSE